MGSPLNYNYFVWLLPMMIMVTAKPEMATANNNNTISYLENNLAGNDYFDENGDTIGVPPSNLTEPCQDEEEAKLKDKDGTTTVLKCCATLYMCQCIEERCDTDPSWQPWCGKCTWDKTQCTPKQCDDLPPVAIPGQAAHKAIIILIVIGVLVALIILCLVIVVTCKKFRRNVTQKDGKNKVLKNPRITVGENFNVSSRAEVQSHGPRVIQARGSRVHRSSSRRK